MKFDNAFKCKSGVIGMQFELSNGVLISVFHDGKEMKVSEAFPEKVRMAALQKYHQLHKSFVRH